MMNSSQRRAIQRIKNLMIKNFNNADLEVICSKMGIKTTFFERLFPNRDSKINEICFYADDIYKAEVLINLCEQLYPAEPWGEEWRKGNSLYPVIYEELPSVSISQEKQPTQIPKEEKVDELKVKLYDILNGKFALTDLEELCFLLDIDWETLRGDDKKAKIRSLLTYIVSRNKLDELVSTLQRVRPDISF